MLSRVCLFAAPWTAARQASLSFTVSQSLLKLMSVESVVPSNPLILSPPSPPAFSLFPASGSFPVSQLFTQVPKVFSISFSFSISPSNEYSGLINFRMDWFDLHAVQGTLRSLLQHSLKASILWHSAFFMVQLTSLHDYWKNHSFDYRDLCQQSDDFAFLIHCLEIYTRNTYKVVLFSY